MAHLHFPHFPAFSQVTRKVIFYLVATIPASLIIYTFFSLIENIVTGKITW
jgi:hypothetical protein